MARATLWYRLIDRARGAGMLDALDGLADAPYRSADEIRERRLEDLRALLAHAERNVPYYRELFADLGITSREIRSESDFARLPVLTKDIVRERLDDLVRDDVPRDELQVYHSGGSTGVPLTFYRDARYMRLADAGVMRVLTQCGWRPGEMLAFFWGWDDRLAGMSRPVFLLRQLARRRYQFDPFEAGPDDFQRWLGVWSLIRPRAAHGYASTIARFAEHILRSGRRVPALRGVFTTAEKLFPEQRRAIREAFGCKVYDQYGSSEVQNIAAECPRGRMHINADFVHVEVDETTAVGDAHPFILTSLLNYAMPFIRYVNGDCGRLSEETCDCGNRFPLMTLDIARVSDNFRFSSGRVVHGEYFTHLLYGARGIESFQFHQIALDRIVLRVVPSQDDGGSREAAVRKAIDGIRSVAPEVSVDVEEVGAIPTARGGKHRFTRSDVLG